MLVVLFAANLPDVPLLPVIPMQREESGVDHSDLEAMPILTNRPSRGG